MRSLGMQDVRDILFSDLGIREEPVAEEEIGRR